MTLKINLDSLVKVAHEKSITSGDVVWKLCQESYETAVKSFIDELSEIGGLDNNIIKEELSKQFSSLGVSGGLSKLFEVHIEPMPTNSAIPFKGLVKQTKFCDDLVTTLRALS